MAWEALYRQILDIDRSIRLAQVASVTEPTAHEGYSSAAYHLEKAQKCIHEAMDQLLDTAQAMTKQQLAAQKQEPVSAPEPNQKMEDLEADPSSEGEPF